MARDGDCVVVVPEDVVSVFMVDVLLVAEDDELVWVAVVELVAAVPVIVVIVVVVGVVRITVFDLETVDDVDMDKEEVDVKALLAVTPLVVGTIVGTKVVGVKLIVVIVEIDSGMVRFVMVELVVIRVDSFVVLVVVKDVPELVVVVISPTSIRGRILLTNTSEMVAPFCNTDVAKTA